MVFVLDNYVDINIIRAMSTPLPIGEKFERPAANDDAALPFSATLEVRDACLCLHVQRAARALARRFDEVLRPLGLTSGQFSLLMSLNRPHPPTIGSVAELLAMDRTTLTANLKPLERRGLLEIAVDREDKRSRRLIITAVGRALLARAYPIWRETHTAVEFKIAPGSADELRAALTALL
jgi:DNA-binding MarR family transcriptional regulator